MHKQPAQGGSPDVAGNLVPVSTTTARSLAATGTDFRGSVSDAKALASATFGARTFPWYARAAYRDAHLVMLKGMRV